MKIKIVAKTDIGHHREQNEDSFTFCPDLRHPEWEKTKSHINLGEFGSLLAVADGMGGTYAGEVASSLSIETIKKQFSPSKIASVIQDERQIMNFLSETVRLADKAIDDVAEQRPETYGMGTTIVICWILNKKAYIAWCGDSRCYIYSKESGLKALTKDHSLVQEEVDRGEITEEEAFYHPNNSIITRGLGDFGADTIPDIAIQTIHPNDIVLLCSDGLCGYCSNHTIEKILKSKGSRLNRCCNELIQTALKSGADDNITIVLATLLNNNSWFHFLSPFKNRE